MKLRTFAAVGAASVFIWGSVAANAQGNPPGITSGPAAGGKVQPQSTPDASRMRGPAGSKNGPAAKAPAGSTANAPEGNAGAAGVAGPAGSKNGPPQRSGSSKSAK
jgi:hypothetical protein